MTDDYLNRDFEYMLDGWRAMQQEITRLREENKRLEKEIKKSRVALLRIQCIAQDITRPIPFQEEDDEN